MKAAGLPLPFSSPQQRESRMNRVQFTLSFPQKKKNPPGPTRGRRGGGEGEGEKRHELREKETKGEANRGDSR